jgi:hypothetical protein
MFPSIYDAQDKHKRQFSSGRVRDRRQTEALCAALREAEEDGAVSAREILTEHGIEPERTSILTEEFAREAFGSAAEGQNAAIIQYSGGADSTCAAVLAALLFDRVHLLTFENSFTRETNRSAENARKLVRLLPEKDIVHQQRDTTEGLNELLFGDYLEDLRQYGITPVGWPCLACKLSFDVETARYGSEYEVQLVADGSDLRVEYQFSQGDRSTLGLRDEWFASQGMTFVHPVASIEDTVTELLLFSAERGQDALLYPQQGCCIGNDMLATAYKRFYYIPRFGMDRLRSEAAGWMLDKRGVCDALVGSQGAGSGDASGDRADSSRCQACRGSEASAE